MWFMYLLSWFAFFIQICFITLSIAAGLYYLAEIVEEFTVMTGKLIKYMIWFTSLVYVGLLLFENLPISLIGIGLLCNGAYLLVLKTFPFIELSSPTFIFNIIVIIINHYLAFQYFSQVWHPFSEVLGFFTVCLWLVPFTFFVSLSANDNVLPTVSESTRQDDGDIVSNYFSKKTKGYRLLNAFKYAQDTLLPQRVKKGY